MDGNQPKRKAGRPKGSLGAVLADLTDQVTLCLLYTSDAADE